MSAHGREYHARKWKTVNCRGAKRRQRGEKWPTGQVDSLVQLVNWFIVPVAWASIAQCLPRSCGQPGLQQRYRSLACSLVALASKANTIINFYGSNLLDYITLSLPVFALALALALTPCNK